MSLTWNNWYKIKIQNTFNEGYFYAASSWEGAMERNEKKFSLFSELLLKWCCTLIAIKMSLAFLSSYRSVWSGINDLKFQGGKCRKILKKITLFTKIHEFPILLPIKTFPIWKYIQKSLNNTHLKWAIIIQIKKPNYTHFLCIKKFLILQLQKITQLLRVIWHFLLSWWI